MVDRDPWRVEVSRARTVEALDTLYRILAEVTSVPLPTGRSTRVLRHFDAYDCTYRPPPSSNAVAVTGSAPLPLSYLRSRMPESWARPFREQDEAMTALHDKREIEVNLRINGEAGEMAKDPLSAYSVLHPACPSWRLPLDAVPNEYCTATGTAWSVTSGRSDRKATSVLSEESRTLWAFLRADSRAGLVRRSRVNERVAMALEKGAYPHFSLILLGT